MQKVFLFNLNRCTGCGACIVACALEKDAQPGINRRQVLTFNENRHPALPVFILSLACNHCVKPACLNNCPAAAITKEPHTGAVILNTELCMGCKYCTWACPYDAPRFDATAGTAIKCDFCAKRLQNGEKPACVCACPTDALNLDEKDPLTFPEPQVEGFPQKQLLPALEFIPLRPSQRCPEASALQDIPLINSLFTSCLDIPPKKISLKIEWTLLVFTSLAATLTAWFTAFFMGSFPLHVFLFLALGGFAMALSTLHLGKKQRAYRAILNIGHSWLSREIFLFSAFLGLSGLYMLFFPQLKLLGYLTMVVGFTSLFAIDRIYQVALHVGPSHIHSAHTLFNGLYLAGWLTANLALFATPGLFKLTLYIYRKSIYKHLSRPDLRLVSVARVLLGFLLPLLIWMGNPKAMAWYGALAILLGDFIDRTEYYQELDIITPRKQMLWDLINAFKHFTNKKMEHNDEH